MAEQLKKLLYNKKFVDSSDGGHIAEWAMSPWKVFVLFIAFLIFAIFIYGWFFQADKQNYFGNVIFYTTVLILAIVAIWIIGRKALDFKQRITYFLIAFVLLWVFYWLLGFIFDILGNPGEVHFQIGGTTLWVILTLLAFIGAKRIDGEIDRNDLLFGLMCFVIFIGANIPMNSNGGFLLNVDKIIDGILNYFGL